MKKALIICCIGITLVGCKNKRCEYIDMLGIEQICEKQYPNEKVDFCSDVSRYMRNNMPNRIRTKTCYQQLTKSEQEEFWNFFKNGVEYAQIRSHRY